MKKILFISIMLLFISSCPAVFSQNIPVVVSCAGKVDVFPSGSATPVVCAPGMRVGSGTRIVTGEEAYAEIAFDKWKNNIVKIKANSEVIIKLNGKEKIELIDGDIFTVLKDIKKGDVFRVRTPSAVCGARGTGWETATDGTITTISVFNDTVFVRGINKDGSVMEKEYLIKEGFERTINKFNEPGEEKPIPEDILRELRKEVSQGTIKEALFTKKLHFFDNERSKREEQVEGINERKNEKHIDKLNEKKESTDNGTGYSITRD